MLDIQLLRKDLQVVVKRLSDRGYTFDAARFLELDSQRRTIQTEKEVMQATNNQVSTQVFQIRSRGEDASHLIEQANTRAEEIKTRERKQEEIERKLQELLLGVPNLPHESVPVGKSSEDNPEVRKGGTPRTFQFPIKDHVDIGVAMGLDFDTASKISGARFVLMKGQIARLHRALAQFMLDIHTQEHGYTEVYVPYLVNAATMNGTGQLPKFESDLFCTFSGTPGNFVADMSEIKAIHDETKYVLATNKGSPVVELGKQPALYEFLRHQRGYYLIPTAEVPVTNIVREEIISQAKLPLKFVCHTPCFRSEAGSYGKDTRGMIRQHQFDKVELVQIVHPERSYQALEELTSHAETVLKRLDLPYRVVTLCTADTGFAAAKTYDLEVWLPAQKAYREISSCSNCEAFQARRMQARFRNGKGKTEFVHTLNGSGLAVGRTLIAVLENYQRRDGGVDIPAALQPHMGGLKTIRPAGGEG